MSEVISFRLNKDNLREANALLILQEWRTKGYSTRQTITEAILKLDQNVLGSDITALADLNEVLCQANHLLRQIEGDGSLLISAKRKNHPNNSLSKSFITSVKMSAKQGLKVE